MLIEGQNTLSQSGSWTSCLFCGTFSNYLGHGCTVPDKHDKKCGAETKIPPIDALCTPANNYTFWLHKHFDIALIGYY